MIKFSLSIALMFLLTACDNKNSQGEVYREVFSYLKLQPLPIERRLESLSIDELINPFDSNHGTTEQADIKMFAYFSGAAGKPHAFIQIDSQPFMDVSVGEVVNGKYRVNTIEPGFVELLLLQDNIVIIVENAVAA